jgi:hypothetical protein
MLLLQLVLPRFNAGEEGRTWPSSPLRRCWSTIASRLDRPTGRNVRYPSAGDASADGGGAFELSVRRRAYLLPFLPQAPRCHGRPSFSGRFRGMASSGEVGRRGK